MSEERFEVIVIGGGLAGLSAAYRLSKAGRKVLVLEKAPYSGAKNVSGGRIYTYALDKLMGATRGRMLRSNAKSIRNI